MVQVSIVCLSNGVAYVQNKNVATSEVYGEAVKPIYIVDTYPITYPHLGALCCFTLYYHAIYYKNYQIFENLAL